MLWREVLDLIVFHEGQDDEGFPVDIEDSRRTNIYANKKSVRQSEFYLASAQGINLVKAFEIATDDYNGERKLEYDGVPYYIVRTYDKNNEITELTCSDKKISVSGKG